MGKIVRLDLDDYRISKEELLDIARSLPKPFYIRRSSFNHGYHIKFPCPFPDNCPIFPKCYNCHFYLLYDDRMRLNLNMRRQEKGLSHDVLFDIKDNKRANEWIKITNMKEMHTYLSTLKENYK